MGITKTEGFTKEITDMAEVLKTLGHPARLAIVEFLIKSPSCICNDIVDVIPLAQPTISRHLSELKRVGLIQGNIEGKNICYCINPKRWADVQKMVDNLSTQMAETDNCC